MPTATDRSPPAAVGLHAATAGRRRRNALAVAAAVGLAGPTALAFFSGGYFAPARSWAGLLAWALAAVGVALGAAPLPVARSSRVAIAALAGLAVWTLASVAWAPVAGAAYGAGELAALYVGALIAAAALLRGGKPQRAAEPALAAGTAIVIGYGIAERLVPGLLHYARSVTAQGRLEQPLTYWNAMGELAALGFVLAARLAGDATRPRGLRAAAAAAGVPLGLGVYMSFSRGALFACVAGLIALVVLAPTVAQLRGALLTVGTGVLAVLVCAPFRAVTLMRGSLGTQERDGAIVLVALVVVGAVTALAARRALGPQPDAPLRLPRRAPLLALLVICAGFALAVALGAHESNTQPLAAGATRYETFQSNRYAYWGVAFQAFASAPVQGVGAGGWAVWWLRHRTVNAGAQDAHSLELQTLAELGLVGVALLAALIAATALAARRALRAAPAAAAGPAAGLVVYIAHSPLDWDWQMPAVTLIAVALAGLVLALADRAGPA